MNDLEEWIDSVIRQLQIEAAVDRDGVRDLTLDLARDVAHAVERRAAPVTTFLLGVAAGRSQDPRDAATRYAAAIRTLLNDGD